MRYTPAPADLYIQNRERLRQLLRPQSVAVLHSADITPKSADGTRSFIQQTDIFYLSGIDQEETILLIAPDAPDPEMREVLFIRETSEQIAIWEGAKFTKEQATAISGIANVQWITEFERIFAAVAFAGEHLYLNTNEHLRAVIEVETRDARFIKRCKEKYPLHEYQRLQPLMHHLRAVKTEPEIVQLQRAIDITDRAFRRLLGFVRPGVMEYEVEAEMWHEFIRSGSRGMAYEPIIASGPDACVLHYISNDKACQDGHLLLMDFGCEYGNYNADLTRTIPVNGRFSPRQRQVYDAVLRVQKASMQMLRPGNTWTEWQKETAAIIESELIGLGLLNKHDVERQDPKNPLYKKYFMHGIGHHLGLDVHDYGDKYRKFEEGMVFTCEPGIYIREEGIGVRIEDNLVITSGEPRNLMGSIPKEAEEIEDLMNSR